jgi:hypothetical protein
VAIQKNADLIAMNNVFQEGIAILGFVRPKTQELKAPV